ncbi:hypothetical protein C0995_015443 [Termitomyces sp. Mi166|nr:hypothetical protein C0995_015443 [Termitomyces sp. Mi166\
MNEVGRVVLEFGPTVPAADRHHESNQRHGSVSHSHSPPPVYGSIGYTNAYGLPRGKLRSSPDYKHRSNSSLNVVPEDRIIMEFSRTIEPETPRYAGGAALDGDEEVEEWELDEELEQQGLYRAFALLAALPHVCYPMTEAWPYPSVPYLRHPLLELLTSAALFSLSYLLRDPISSLITFILPSPSRILPTVLATSLHTLLHLTLQQSSLVLLSVMQHAPMKPTTHDAAFRRVWWLALGWACAEAVIGISKGYQARALYRDVLVTVRRSQEASGKFDGTGSRAFGHIGTSSSGSRSPRGKEPEPNQSGSIPGQSTLELFERQVEDDVYDGHRSQPFGDEEMGEHHPLLPKGVGSQEQAIKLLVEDELDGLIAIRAREELEDAYGVPVIRIPIFLTCLQRINDLLLSLGLTLLLSKAYLRSAVSRDDPPSGTSNLALIIGAPVVWAVQCYLALLHTPLILPRMGIPAVVYHASLVSLSAFFGGLAAWNGLS